MNWNGLRIGWLLLAVVAGLWSGSVGAEEPARQFLDGLRARGYHDTALDYLDWIATSDLAPQELKEAFKFEKGLTLIAASRIERDRQVQTRQLDEAQRLIDQFVQENSQHSLANSARSQLGNLVAERARIEMRRAQQGDRAQHMQRARSYFEKAHQVYRELRENVKEQLKAIPTVLDVTDRKQAALAERRTRLRADYLDTLLQAAAIREEMAETHERGSDAYNKLLTEAATRYEEIYKSYRMRTGGLFARMYQGRTQQKLGRYREALGFFVELLDQPDAPAPFRRLKTETMQLAMECWLHKSQKKYVEAIRRGSQWLGKARADDDRHPDWLELRLMLARAYLMQADDLRQANSPDTRTINQSLNEARKLANMVARYEGQHQRAAREMIALLGGPDRTGEKPQPRNFVQARKAGTDALEAVESSRVAVEELSLQLRRETDAGKKAALQQRLNKARRSLDASALQATDNFRLAITLADHETAIAELNFVRYFLCYLYYLQKDYYRSAILGEFLARRYPDSAGARPSAKIAMASYLLLHDQSPVEDREAETDHIISVAEYIVASWPDQAEAQDAIATLIPFVINAGELDKARAFLSQLAAGSPHRTEAELKTGKAMWQAYLRGKRELRAAVSQLSPAQREAKISQLDELKTSAPHILEAAYGRLQPDVKVDYDLLAALLALAQAYVENQQPLPAVGVLEHEHFGPLTLVRKRHPATQRAGFAEESYRTALQAQIAALTAAPAPDDAIRGVTKLMSEMKHALGQEAETQKRLISIYVGLAQDLEARLKVATPQAQQSLSRGFEAILTQLGANSSELEILNWVAETFASLGAGFDNQPDLTPQAAGYYEQSAAAFERILVDAQPDPRMRTQMQVRLAVVKRRQRRFDESLAELVEVLRNQSAALNVQVEAAITLQAWADSALPAMKSGLYDRAMLGDQPDPRSKRNLVWGWGRIAKETAPYAQFRETFHQARFNLALCRFGQAQVQRGEQQTRLLAMAEKDISLTKRLYGLGGDRWQQQYDALLKQIQQSKGDPEIGVRVFEPQAKPSAE